MKQVDVDELTRKLFVREQCEDPFCCNLVRHDIVNEIREAFGLDKLDSKRDDYAHEARP